MEKNKLKPKNTSEEIEDKEQEEKKTVKKARKKIAKTKENLVTIEKPETNIEEEKIKDSKSQQKSEKLEEKKDVKKIEVKIEKDNNKDKNSESEVEKTDNHYQSKKSHKKTVFLILFFVLILLTALIYNFFSGNLNKIIDKNGSTSLAKQIKQLATETNEPLKGENEDRINILLLGMGGGDHNGGNLTDTIMIASIKPSTKEISLLSLPRDLVVKIYDNEGDKEYWGRKINYAYELGGMDLAVEKVKEVTGLDVHYYVLLDFAGFIKIIDDIGGISVNVTNRFNGYYHIADVGGTCNGADGGPVYLADGDGPYCIFRFYQGEKPMYGQESLMYSRIRKVAYSAPDNEYYEGSDFARSKRQQKILESFQEKIFSTSTLANPIKITKVIGDLGEHLTTNMQLWEMAKFLTMAENFNKDHIINEVIDETSGLLEGQIYPETGAFVLVPTAGEYDFSEIQEKVKNIFTKENTEESIEESAQNSESQAEEEIVEEVEETANIMILNGTTKVGLAALTQENLEKLDFKISEIGNAPDQEEKLTEKTIIFDLNEKNPKTLAKLKTEINTSEVLKDFEMFYPNHELNINNTDFIIILGADQY